MGRLTLNVAAVFRQFEREVTGERIRDKIAASSAGLWMGGNLPLDTREGPSARRQPSRAETVSICSRGMESLGPWLLFRPTSSVADCQQAMDVESGKRRGGWATAGRSVPLLRNPIILDASPIAARPMTASIRASCPRSVGSGAAMLTENRQGGSRMAGSSEPCCCRGPGR